MNVIDYKDAEFAQIVQEKAANSASAAAEAGADLLLVQEAPGPQLLHHGGAAARRSAECHAFEEALTDPEARTRAPGGRVAGVLRFELSVET
mgnify:FL=1